MPRPWPTAFRARRAKLAILSAAGVAVLASAGCAAVVPRGLSAPAPVPESPTREVSLPAILPRPEAKPAPAIPEDLLEPGATLTLAQVVDVALKNNPLTRISYLQALSAAAGLGSARAAYYPTIEGTVSGTRTNAASVSPSAKGVIDVYGPTVTLNYLLFDIGGRAANAEDSRLGLLAADWTHNSTVQNVVLDVETAYVRYLNAKAQLDAAKANVATFQTALDAANGRHEAGVATIAEVLQARTALSQAQLALETAQGVVQVVRGSLATAMGLSANVPYDVGTLAEEMPIEQATPAIDDLIAKARTARPDLAAAEAIAQKESAHVKAVRSAGLPSLSLSASAARTYYQPGISVDSQNSWSAGVLLSFPIFTGFAQSYNLKKAKEDAEVARAEADDLEQQVVLQVWTSYYALSTAAQLVKTSRDLLASAEESERVALARYKQGVGTILDLLTAQSALAGARAQEIQARAGWFASLAQLAHDVGLAAPLERAMTLRMEVAKP